MHGVERTKKTAAGPRRRAGPARWRSVDWPLARAAAVKVARAVGRPRCGADWSLALKAAALAAVLGEGWLWGAVEGVVRRKSPADNPWAYLHRCLDDGAKQRGARLPRLLAQIVIPPEVLADGPERPEARLNCDRAMLAEL